MLVDESRMPSSRQLPFFALGVAYMLIGAGLLRSGCGGINHADGTGEGLLAAMVGVAGTLSLATGAVFIGLGRRVRHITGRPYRLRLLALAVGVAPFAIYGWIRLTGE